MKKDFNWLASELARQTHDFGADDTTGLDVAQASHALKILQEIAQPEAASVAGVLGLTAIVVSRSSSE